MSAFWWVCVDGFWADWFNKWMGRMNELVIFIGLVGMGR